MKKSKIKLSSNKATPEDDGTKEGWWYEDKSSISVFAQTVTGEITAVLIRKSQILKWLERVK